MRVLVTGGHGFVGSHLVEELLARGAQVRCLNRRSEVPERLRGPDIEVVSGDLESGAGLASAVRGVSEIWHLGALTRSTTRRRMFAVNAGGTERLLAAAAATGFTGRFVLCSSLSAVGPASAARARREDDPPAPQTTYGRSKLLAEAHVRRRGTGLDWVIVRPPAVYGPRDRDFLGLFRAASRGWLPQVGPAERRLSLIYVEDLAAGLLAAGRGAAAGGRAWFVTADPPVTQAILCDALATALGARARRLRLPTSLARLAGCISDLGGQLTGVTPLLTRERVREVGEGDWTCSGEALALALGWRAQVPLAEGLRRTVAAYRAEGQL